MTSSSNTQPSVRIFESAELASLAIADEVAADVLRMREQGRTPVLGLPTGATPESIYGHWCRLHQQQGFDWHNVATFNLDEYWPMPQTSEHSYHRFMNQRLFSAAGFDAELTAMPSGTVHEGEIEQHCADYERNIVDRGGIDIQLLGIGVNGHLGFNEPESDAASRTRRVQLTDSTRDRAQPGFGDAEVPRYGITIGLATIFDARKIYLLAFGAAKADAVHAALHGPVTESCPGSLLQRHSNVEWVLDADAAALLG